MPRLNDGYFGEILRLFAGKRIGLVRNPYGNVGDGLIERGTTQLLERNGIPFRLIDPTDLRPGEVPADVDMLAASGGGNIGTFYVDSPKGRIMMRRVPCPKIILSQSAFDTKEDLSGFEVIFARELRSYELLRSVHEDVRLAPDMALALDIQQPAAPTVQNIVCMRRDKEKTATIYGEDPAEKARDTDEYISMAGAAWQVHTNRLHFAIAAALQDRQAFLRPNSYHKNRSMYETWLRLLDNFAWEDV